MTIHLLSKELKMPHTAAAIAFLLFLLLMHYLFFLNLFVTYYLLYHHIFIIHFLFFNFNNIKIKYNNSNRNASSQ